MNYVFVGMICFQLSLNKVQQESSLHEIRKPGNMRNFSFFWPFSCSQRICACCKEICIALPWWRSLITSQWCWSESAQTLTEQNKSANGGVLSIAQFLFISSLQFSALFEHFTVSIVIYRYAAKQAERSLKRKCLRLSAHAGLQEILAHNNTIYQRWNDELHPVWVTSQL